MPDAAPRSSVETLIDGRLEFAQPAGRRFAPADLRRTRSLEAYLQAGGRPRWMQRLIDVDRGIAAHEARLAAAHAALAAELAGAAPETFARRWTELARRWAFGELNELIDQHNRWYPIERDLPMDPRTGEYVRVHGRDFLRPVLDAAWILERFPAHGTRP